MARLNARPPVSTVSRSPSASPPESSPGQENRDPNSEAREKQKRRAMADARPPAVTHSPASDGSDAPSGQKRRRVEANVAADRGQGADEDHDEEDGERAERFHRYFDPNQDPEQRREIKRKSRALEREFQGRSHVRHRTRIY